MVIEKKVLNILEITQKILKDVVIKPFLGYNIDKKIIGKVRKITHE